MRDESWNFLSTFLENLPIEVLFNADFDGVVQIVDFRQAISVKNYNLSFCTCLDTNISFLAFSIRFWGFWPIEHLRNQLVQSFGFACFDRNACASPSALARLDQQVNTSVALLDSKKVSQKRHYYYIVATFMKFYQIF